MALSCFTIGGRAFRKTLKPQIHLISGSRESSSTVTRVPQRMHSYATELSPDEASMFSPAPLFESEPHILSYTTGCRCRCLFCFIADWAAASIAMGILWDDVLT